MSFFYKVINDNFINNLKIKVDLKYDDDKINITSFEIGISKIIDYYKNRLIRFLSKFR